jgi:hypothetical protein
MIFQQSMNKEDFKRANRTMLHMSVPAVRDFWFTDNIHLTLFLVQTISIVGQTRDFSVGIAWLNRILVRFFLAQLAFSLVGEIGPD